MDLFFITRLKCEVTDIIQHTNQLKMRWFGVTEVYLEPIRVSKMKLFCEISFFSDELFLQNSFIADF